MQIKNGRTYEKSRTDIYTYHFNRDTGNWCSADTCSSVRDLICTFGFGVFGQVDYFFATNSLYEIKFRKSHNEIKIYVTYKSHKS